MNDSIHRKNLQEPETPFKFQAKLYLVTRLGTIIGLTFDFARKVVVGVKVSTYVKNILGAFPMT